MACSDQAGHERVVFHNRVIFIVPGDPGQKTGGYRYVCKLVDALNAAGVATTIKGLAGQFPVPDDEARGAMEAALAELADQDPQPLVVLDGLAMGGLPDVVTAYTERLHLVALVHHPLADETGLTEEAASFLFQTETQALAAVRNIISTSGTTASRLADFSVSPSTVTVITPGANTVSSTRFDAPHSERPFSECLVPECPKNVPEILCVATLAPRKAQHQLIDALASLVGLPWHCTLVGSLERCPEYSQGIADQIQSLGLSGRISLAGEQDDDALAANYCSAQLFVLPSLYEGYGMVIDEALAAGLPVITTDGGALASTGDRDGVCQYPAGDSVALQGCLKAWLTDSDALEEATRCARIEAQKMRSWADAAGEFQEAFLSIKNQTNFDQDWLKLREPVDHRARNCDVLTRVQQWVESSNVQGETQLSSPLRITDLGAGAGSNGVFLSPALPACQHWTLLDQDGPLLAVARDRVASSRTCIETRVCSLDANRLPELIPDNTRMITASALIDLMPADWLDALAVVAEKRHAAVLIVLSYAGDFQLQPPLPDDQWIKSQINDHQHGDKGTGAAMGPDATGYLRQRLESEGYQVTTGPSPWTLTESDKDLQSALVAGWCDAVREQCPAETTRIARWESERLAQANSGVLSIQVSHDDLFAWLTDEPI